MSCTLAAPPGTPATMRSISPWPTSPAAASTDRAVQPAESQARHGASAESAAVGDHGGQRRQRRVGEHGRHVGRRAGERRRSTSLTASNECPPSSKKSSSRPTRSTPRTRSQIPARCRFDLVDGLGVGALAISSAGSGSARRSSLPFGVDRQRVERRRRRRGPCTRAGAPATHAETRRRRAACAGELDVGDQALVGAARPRGRRRRPAHARVLARARPRSRPARCGSRGSSPGRRCGRGTRACRRRASGRGRRSGRGARPVANGSATKRCGGQLRPARGSRARVPRRRCTARRDADRHRARSALSRT